MSLSTLVKTLKFQALAKTGISAIMKTNPPPPLLTTSLPRMDCLVSGASWPISGKEVMKIIW